MINLPEDVERTTITANLTKEEAKKFDEAVRKSGRFLSKSDALRYLIRKFIEEVEEGKIK